MSFNGFLIATIWASTTTPVVPESPVSLEAPPVVQTPATPEQLGQVFVRYFNQGNAEGLASLFTEKAELVDEEGVIYAGREAIESTLDQFFERYSNIEATFQETSVRALGTTIALEDGVVTFRIPETGTTARNRYVSVLYRSDESWKIASMRQYPEADILSPREYLEPLDWLVGDWVSEGADLGMKLSCRWAEEENFLLVDFILESGEAPPIKTTQRIGWDGLEQTIRSWSFDNDGGFAEGEWSTDGANWVVKSEIVLPDGTTGSATFYLIRDGENAFTWSSIDREIAGTLQSEVEVKIVRQPPKPE